MFRTEQLEVWNLSPGGKARSGAVDTFNIVGKVYQPDQLRELRYSLNGGHAKPVYVQRKANSTTRLWNPGEFNIDTIALGDLRDHNELEFLVRTDAGETSERLPFEVVPFAAAEPQFSLDLDRVRQAEEVGQIVEGRWLVANDGNGQQCLRITPEDAGYDRIILFGHHTWTTAYQVRARLTVTRIRARHNLGLVFKWNPHQRGDGTYLPQKWSSGLAYYCSYAKPPGIRIRYGVGVHVDATGAKHGDYLMAQAPFGSRHRRLLNGVRRQVGLGRRASELQVGQEYSFRVIVDPKRYLLSVWESDRPEPPPQVTVDNPAELLDTGGVGILAYQVGVDLHEFEVCPLQR